MKGIMILVFSNLLLFSCSDNNQNSTLQVRLDQLQTKLDSIKNIAANEKDLGARKIASFFTFQEGNAEEAMNFYIGLFENSEIVNVKYWEGKSSGEKGSIMHATFKLDGSLYMCSDSPITHAWDFTPATSNFVECKSEDELKSLFGQLSEEGQVMMPLGNYGFSQQFGFVEDRFGISWQLNLQ